MSEVGKKQNFLHGAMWLALSAIVVKVIGALYKFPLQAIIGDEGYGYFTTAYDIYSVLRTISTAGLPLAMSRAISQANAQGHDRQVRRIFKASRFIFVALGVLSMLAMIAFCQNPYVNQHQPSAWISIVSLAPSAFFIGLMCSYRGFFQGQGNMRPTSMSQMLEAVFKLIVGLGVAYLFLKLTGNIALAAGGAIMGVSFSCLVSTIYLYYKFRPAYSALGTCSEGVTSYRSITKTLMAIAIPVTLGSAGLQIINVIEGNLYMGNLVELAGNPDYSPALIETLKQSILENEPLLTVSELHSKVASNLKGIYNFMLTFFNLPTALILPITVSILPAITEQLTLNHHDQVSATEESAARVTGLLALPCSIGMTVLAGPIAGLSYTGERLELATAMLQILGVCVFFCACVMYTNTILQSHNYAHIPVINTLLCGGVRLVIVYLLSGNPDIGVVGIPVGALFSYVGIFVLNLLAIYRLSAKKPQLIRNLIRPMIPALAMGVGVAATLYVIQSVLGIHSRLILCGAPLAVGVVIYCAGILVCKTIKKEDCLLLPKGEKIAKLLHL